MYAQDQTTAVNSSYKSTVHNTLVMAHSGAQLFVDVSLQVLSPENTEDTEGLDACLGSG